MLAVPSPWLRSMAALTAASAPTMTRLALTRAMTGLKWRLLLDGGRGRLGGRVGRRGLDDHVDLLILVRRRDEQSGALVLGQLTALAADERLDLGDVEPAAEGHETAFVTGGAVGARGHGGNHGVDVALDVDAGVLLELLPLLALVVHEEVEALAELRGHHTLDVGVGDDGGAGRDQGEFVRTGIAREGAGHAAHVGDGAGSEPGSEDGGRTEKEVASLCGAHRSITPV